MLNQCDSTLWVFLDSEGKQQEEEGSPALVHVAQWLAQKEMSLELARSRGLLRSVKTTSNCTVDFGGRGEISHKEEPLCRQLGEDTSAVTIGTQISPRPDSSGRRWYLAAILSNLIVRVSLW